MNVRLLGAQLAAFAIFEWSSTILSRFGDPAKKRVPLSTPRYSYNTPSVLRDHMSPMVQ